MEQLTSEIEQLTQTLYIPEMQKFVRAGFKKVTHGELEERFAIPALNERLQKENRADTLRRANLRPWHWVYDHEIKHYQFLGMTTIYHNSLFTPIIGWGGSLLRKEIPYIAPKAASVQYDHIEAYAADLIPDRCLASLQRAVSLGLKMSQVYVAYPVIGAVKQVDPVIVWMRNAYEALKQPSGSRPEQYDMIEIDMWE